MRPENDRPAERNRRVRSSSSEPPSSSKKEYLVIDALFQWVDFYLDLNWPVLPLHWIEYGSCTCFRASQCASSGKHPRNRNGLHGATTNLKTVHAWLHQWQKANLGVATGGSSHLLVIDIDPRHDGHRSLSDLEVQYERLPRTYTVRTGSGGLHLYFSMKGIDPPIRNSAGKLGPGIDVRGKGGYVVGPPSGTPFGAYTVEEAAPLAPIPGWVVDLLRAPRRLQRPLITGSRLFTPNSAGAVGQAPRSLDEAVLIMLAAAEGSRNHTLNSMAFWAGRQVARGLVSENDVVHRLSLAAELTGLEDDEIERTLCSGFDAGIEQG
jgi:hypothetical protein